MNKKFVITGLILIILGIVLGAFGAHGLKELVSVERIQTFEVGVKYQFYQGLGMLILGLNGQKFNFSLQPVWILLLLGTFFFSGSIYLLSIQEIVGMEMKFLGPITPIGGLLMIIGWMILLAKMIWKKN